MLNFEAIILEVTVVYKFTPIISAMGNPRTASILYLKQQFPTYPLYCVLTIRQTAKNHVQVQKYNQEHCI